MPSFRLRSTAPWPALEVESALGEGSLSRVRLPRADSLRAAEG